MLQARPAPRPLGALILGAAALLLPACCTTRAVLRSAHGSEQLAAVEVARATEEGGLQVELAWFPGTLGTRPGRLTVSAGALAAAHESGVARLPARAMTPWRGEPPSEGRVLALSPLFLDFGWEPDELAALRPPRGSTEALFYQPRVFTWRGPVRFAHVRAGEREAVSVALLELEPTERRRVPALYALVPFTAVFDAFAQPLLAGFVLGFAGLAP